MKRIIAVMLILALLLSTSACGTNKTATAYDIYTQANKALNKIDSLAANTYMVVSMSYAGQMFEVSMTGYVKEVFKSETDVEVELDMNTVAISEETTVKAFYKDGVYYVDANGQKVQMEVPLEQALQLANTEALDFPDTAIKSQQVELKDGEQELRFTLDGAVLTEAIVDQIGDLTATLGAESSITIGDIDYLVFIDKDGNLKTTSLGFSTEIEMLGESIPVNVVIAMDFVQINNVTIDFPSDLDSYIPLNM